MSPFSFSEQRGDSRVNADYPVQITIGSQLTLQGQLKDISPKSAFITIKNSVYLELNDLVGFVICLAPRDPRDFIQGHARVSRIAPGEGIAIYFTSMDDAHLVRLEKFFRQ